MNKASGSDGIPVELFQILKDDAVKVLNMPANLENSAVATGLEKVSFHSNPKERQCQSMLKLPHLCAYFICQQSNAQNSPSWASTYFQMFKLDLEKEEESEIKLPTSVGSLKKQENSRKTPTSVLLTMPKPLTVWIPTNWKILQEMGIPDHLTCLLRNLYAGQEAIVRAGHETTDWFQIGKGVHQGCIFCHPAYLTYMQSTSCEMLSWMNHKLELRLLGKYQ